MEGGLLELHITLLLEKVICMFSGAFGITKGLKKILNTVIHLDSLDTGALISVTNKGLGTFTQGWQWPLGQGE